MDKAREDLEVARVIRRAGASASLAAFHCQQAVEKYLKACLVAGGVKVPHIHDVVEIAARIPSPPDLGAGPEDLQRLRIFAVAPRYPYFPTADAERDLPRLVEIAENVAEHVERVLLRA